MFRWILQRKFSESDVVVRWVGNTRRIEPEVERAIEDAWIATLARCGTKLFNGDIARCESIEVLADKLLIGLSRSTYRIAIGTNFAHSEFVEKFGPEVMANMFGVSAAVVSSDEHLILGRRNSTVAYYPGHVHPFAGNLDVRRDVNLFDDARRELREEIGFSEADIASMELIGIVEDNQLKHPEAVFIVRSTRSKDEVIARIHPDEHNGAWSAPLGSPITNLKDLTPVAQAIVAQFQ